MTPPCPASAECSFLRLARGALAATRALIVLGALSATALAQVSKEYQVKAAFLYNFTKFVDWPPQRLATDNSPIIIGLLIQNPFGDELQKIVKDRKVRGHPIIVRTLSSVAEATSVHVLFVSTGNEQELAGVVGSILRAGVLTVGESPAFTQLGGIVTFTLEADKVRFAINLDAGERAGIKFSVQLLKLATSVTHNPK